MENRHDVHVIFQDIEHKLRENICYHFLDDVFL